MKTPLVECVPNFSEGRRPEVVAAIAARIASVPQARMIDSSSDANHNRSVLTFVAPPQFAVEAAFRAMEEASRSIDLRTHQGEHPRMGATDVVPFIPLAGATMQQCVELARALGERVGRELAIPVYYYEEAATRPERRNLADVRKGEFEGLRTAIGREPAREPDAGPKDAIHPSAGATAIGARFFLIAYNVNLRTQDVQVAKDIAKQIRERDGGLKGIKALGFFLDDQKLAQVSMNVCNYQATGLLQVYERIEQLARARGVEIAESELVGLMPRDALPTGAAQRIRLARFDPAAQVIEEKLARAAP